MKAVLSASRDKLIEQYTPLALRLARRFSPSTRPDPDLSQVAMLGLVEAAERFDNKRGGFASFAIPTINGTLKKHLRKTGWAAHVPRRVQENSLELVRVSEELHKQHHRAPTIAELHESSGLSVEDIHAARRANSGRSRTSLTTDYPVSSDESSEHAELRAAIADLEPETQTLLKLRYNLDLTQKEIADELGISQPQVHRRLTAAAIDLRRSLSEAPELATMTEPPRD